MDFNLVLMAEAIQTLRDIQAQLDYERSRLFDSLSNGVGSEGRELILADKLMTTGYAEANQLYDLELGGPILLKKEGTDENGMILRSSDALAFHLIKVPGDDEAYFRFMLLPPVGGVATLELQGYNGSTVTVLDSWQITGL